MKFKRLISLALATALVLPIAAGCGYEFPKQEEPPAGQGQLPEEQKPGDQEPGDQEPDDQEPDDQEPEEQKKEYALSLEPLYRLATIDRAKSLAVNAALTCDGEACDGEITYAVEDPAVASVAEGTLTALAAGKTALTASYETPEGETLTAAAEIEVLAAATAESVNAFEAESVNLLGRTYFSSERLQLDNPCTGFEVAFYGTELSVKFYRDESIVAVFLDGAAQPALVNTQKNSTIKVAENLEEGIHVLRMVKAVGPSLGYIQLNKSPIATDGEFLKPPAKSDLKIEFIGDSITAGIGASGTPAQTSPTKENSLSTYSYAYLTAQALNADYSIIALSGICVKDSATNMYDRYQKNGFNSSTPYDFTLFDPDVVVLALGENDMWHATSSQFPYDTKTFRRDYADMLRLIREKRPNAYIVCIYGMMPASSTPETKQLITGAIEDTGDGKITQIQMLCNDTGAHSHPNAEAHKTNAQTLAAHIRNLLDKETS